MLKRFTNFVNERKLRKEFELKFKTYSWGDLLTIEPLRNGARTIILHPDGIEKLKNVILNDATERYDDESSAVYTIELDDVYVTFSDRYKTRAAIPVERFYEVDGLGL